jgi:hypothetical protein
MSEMASHWSFGHLQPKLWAKEGPGVPITKSWELTRSQCALGECDTALESFQRRLQVWFRPHPDRRPGQEARMSQSLGSPKSGQFRDSILGVLGKSAIRVQVRWRGIENTIGEDGGGTSRARTVVCHVSPS